MKTQHVLWICATLAIMSCTKSNVPTDASSTPQPQMPTSSGVFISANDYLIDTTTANEQISSYLNSIALSTEEQIKYFQIDAGALRSLLANTSVTSIKVSVAHKSSIVDNPSTINTFQSMNADAITFIISGVDEDGNYVLLDDGYAINRVKNCPTHCVIAGTASSDFIE
jgi:hypothetical protein